MSNYPDRPKRNVKPRPRPAAGERTLDEMPDDEHTRWVASSHVKEEVADEWELPKYEPSESRGRNTTRRTTKDLDLGRKVVHGDITGSVTTPRKRRGDPERPSTERPPTPEPSPRRRRRDPTPSPAPRATEAPPNDEAVSRPPPPVPQLQPPRLPTPEPAPRRREAVPTPEPMPRRDLRASPVASRPPTPAPAPPRRSELSDPPPPPVPLPGGAVLASHAPSVMPGINAMPMDAPTVVRPDLAGLGDDYADIMGEETAQQLSPVASMPPPPANPEWGEDTATVALPPPSKRDPTPEKPPLASLPGSASYSPPSVSQAPPLPTEPLKKPERPLPTPQSGDAKKRKMPKGARVSKGGKFDESDGIEPMQIVWVAFGLGGFMLVAGAFLIGVVYLIAVS